MKFIEMKVFVTCWAILIIVQHCEGFFTQNRQNFNRVGGMAYSYNQNRQNTYGRPAGHQQGQGVNRGFGNRNNVYGGATSFRNRQNPLA